MVDFLTENNSCGKTILNLVSCGNSILAETMRLSRFIPPIFTNNVPQDLSKYSDLIFDFSYFKNVDYYENQIQNQLNLEDLDEEFKDNYIEILTQFYQLFEAIHKYITDLIRYVEELNEGFYIQQTVESVLQNEDGKQLLIEAVYLYGVMMMMLDMEIEAIVRERMMVSYYRYCSSRSSSQTSVDEVCKLLRSSNNRKIAACPEEYLKRIPLDDSFILMVVGRLRSDDIYNQLAIFPHPEHRSTALASQAACLFVLLHYTPSILHNQQSVMREIVDKFFSDNWVISVYMGRVVNLIEAWAPYKAACMALNNTIESNNIKTLAGKHRNNMTALTSKLRNLLKEGTLTQDYVMKHTSKLIDIVRGCNVSLRWILLHSTSYPPTEVNNKKCRQVRDLVLSEMGEGGRGETLFTFLLLTSELELILKETFKDLLDKRACMWESERNEAVEIMKELANAFEGDRPLTRLKKNEKLTKWFGDMGGRIQKLQMETGMLAGGRIVKMIQALDEVQEFHQVENVQVKQFIEDSKNCLHKMIKVLNIKEDNLISLQIISDLSYAWKIIDNLTPHMQSGIKRDPFLVIKLRATILKLASALDLPLLRINQSNSPDLVSVSQYYSSQLVTYVRKVLQIIPETMFALLSQIIDLLTNNIKEVPTRLDKDKLRKYAQLEDRYKVAQLTQAISIFTEGMLKMKSTLIGIIKVDPKELLDDGIRKELVKRVSIAIHNSLVFREKKDKGANLMERLAEVGRVVDGYRRSFEYIQDYINIYGLKVWQEEYSRIINYNVEQECNMYVRNKVQDWQSVYQSQSIPIPFFPPSDSCVNFIGRLLNEILRITNPQTCIYLDHLATWYDCKTKQEVITVKLFQNLEKAIGPWGLLGLDKLLSFMIAQSLNSLLTHIDKNVFNDRSFMESLLKLRTDLKLDTCAKTCNYDYVESFMIIYNSQKVMQTTTSRFNKNLSKCLEYILKVGQMQILRRLINQQLSSLCTFQSKFLHASLTNFNNTLLAEMQQQKQPVTPSTTLLAELASCLEAAGINNPLEKVYIKTKGSSSSSLKSQQEDEVNMLLTCVIITLSILPRMTYVKKIDGIVTSKASDGIDGTPLVISMVTMMRQFPDYMQHQFIDFLSAYAKASAHPSSSLPKDRPPEVSALASFLSSFQQFQTSNTQTSFEASIPPFLLQQLKLQSIY